MKLKSLTLLTLVTSSILSNNAHAGFVYTDWGKITHINLTGDASLTLSTPATRINPALCTFSAYKISKNDPNFSEYFTLILAAKGFESEVRFRIDDTNCVDTVNPKIIFIETKDPS